MNSPPLNSSKKNRKKKKKKTKSSSGANVDAGVDKVRPRRGYSVFVSVSIVLFNQYVNSGTLPNKHFFKWVYPNTS